MRPTHPLPAALLALALHLCTTAAQAQEHVVPAPNRWSIGLNMGAGLAYRGLAPTSGRGKQIEKDRNANESWLPGPIGRISVGYRLSNTFGLEVGVGYARYGWKHKTYLGGMGVAPSEPMVMEAKQYFHYLDLPIGISASFCTGRWRSVSSLGIAPAYLAAQDFTSKLTPSDGPSDASSTTIGVFGEDFILMAYLRTGVSYELHEQLDILLQPGFRYGLFSPVHTPVKTHLYMATLDLGLRWTL